MKVPIILLCLFSVAFAKRATVTLLQPRMYATDNVNTACRVKDLSDPNFPKLDNCPGGSTCVETSQTGKGRCTVFTLAVHQGATAFDYTASKIIRAETQLTSTGSNIDCDLTAIPPGNLTAGDPASTVTTDEAKWRCIEHAVHMFLGDDETVGDYQSSCTVSYGGNIGSKMTSGTLGNAGMDGVTLSNNNFVSNSALKKLSCHYVPQNNKYLGYGYAQITFTKKASSLGLGEKADKIIKVPMRFVPGDSVVAGDVDDDSSSPHDPPLTSAHQLLSQPAASDGILYASSTSSSGKLKIDYRLNVMDKRYFINSQSGVEVLNQAAGNFNLIKEGLEIHHDYSNFYDASKNSFLNAGINGVPLDYAAYKTGNCTTVGQSTAGGSLTATGCAIGGDYYGRDFAQYELAGTYEAEYGGLAHWKKGYIGCQLCTNRLAIQGYSNNGSPQIDVAIDVDVAQLNSGCVAINGTNCITLDNIFGTTVGDGVENGKALRLPNCDSSGGNCGSAGGYDPQHATGHVLGEFFTPKIEGTLDYGDYDSNFDILSTSRLIVTDDTKLINATSDSGLTVATACTTFGRGKVYKLSNDMLSVANDLFYNKCRIVVRDEAFAKKSNIVFFHTASDKSSCTFPDTACNNAVYAEITQVDGRRIFVGNSELSLLRRQVATVDKAGASITMSISKFTETASQILRFDIVGTNTMMGFDADSNKCNQTRVDDVDNKCREVAVESELSFDTSDVNGKPIYHTIRSTPDCAGFLDAQFKDKDDAFAVYDIRIPCSRTTAKAIDKVELTFDFTLGYDLVTNKVTAKAYYLHSMSSYQLSNSTIGTGSGLEEDLEVSVSYGYCSSANVIVRNNATGAFQGCSAAINATGEWKDQANQQHFLSDRLNLDDWSHCANKVEDDFANDAYIITTRIAMNYKRTLKYTSGTGATQSVNNFCADRKFVTTIKRDATATVTVATLRAPTLERAVTVTDIEWQACSEPNSFKLVIDMASKQKDIEEDDTKWVDSNLKRVLKPTTSGSKDTDSLMVNVGPMTAANPSHTFSLQSACITVTADDCDERCTNNVCSAQTTAADTSESDYSRLTHTETDLVLRGVFTHSDVDSDVNIITKYVDCPVQRSNQATGYLLAGATMDCDNAITTGPSPTVNDTLDCKDAFTTDSGTANVKLYITNSNAADHLLTAGEATAANTAKWRIRHADIYIERYEKNFDGTEGSQVSSERFCECGSKSTTYNEATACVKQADRVYQLIPFSTLECGKTTTTITNATTNESTDTHTYDRIRFNFLPLADATNDIFKVKFVLLAENTDLDDASSRRRLRSVTHYQVFNRRKRLSSTSSVSASASGLAMQQPSYNTADDDAPAPAPAAPSAPANAPVEDETVMEPGHEHDTKLGLELDTFLWIIVGVIGVVFLLMITYFGNKGCGCFDSCFDNMLCKCCMSKKGMEASSSNVGGSGSSGGFAAVGFREKRFSNLRY